MSNPTLSKNYLAAAALDPGRIVVLTADDSVNLATSATAASIGVTDEITVAANARVDVVLSGIAWVTAGAALTRGSPITADASGRAVAAAAVGNRIVGIALEAAAAAGDRIRVVIAQGVL